MKRNFTIHSAFQTQKYTFALFLLTGFFSVYPFMVDSGYSGSADMHAVMEIAGATMGLLAGLGLVIRFYSLGNRFHLLIGLAFFVNGTEDLIHGLMAFRNLFGLSELKLAHFIPATYVTGRILFGLILIVSAMVVPRFYESDNPKKETMWVSATVILTSLLLTYFVSFIPLPELVFPSHFISRPADFVSALVLLVALTAILRKYFSDKDMLSWWVALSVGLAVVGQVMMSFSKSFYDLFFDISHLYKIIGYAIPVLGFSLFQIGIFASQKEGEKLLQISEIKQRTIIESIPDGLITINRQGLIININNRISELFGYTFKELEFQPIELLIPDHLIAAHIKHRESYLLNPQMREMGSGLELYAKRKDNTLFYVEVLLSPFTINEEKFTLCVLRDISERKKEEEEKNKLTKAIEQAADGIFILDKEGNIEYVNYSFEKLSGYAKEEVIGKSPKEFKFSSDDIKEFEELWEKVIRGEKAQSELANKKKSGEKYYIEKSITPVINDKGVITHFVSSEKDITEKKKSEEALLELFSKLEEKNKELVDFLYIASHDLQEPLRKVQGFGDMLKKKYSGNLGEEGADYINRMQNASGRMQKLIDALLLYSRVTTKGRSFEPTDLNQVLKDVISDLEFSIEKAEAQVTVEKLPVIMADEMQIREVFLNLISNAIKFRKQNEPLEIKIHHVNGDNNSQKNIQLAVEDNGIGIDEKYADKVFEVFQKLHSAQEYAGTGIGLSICKKIIERHGGTISFKSEPGRGTRFIINLPVNKKK